MFETYHLGHSDYIAALVGAAVGRRSPRRKVDQGPIRTFESVVGANTHESDDAMGVERGDYVRQRHVRNSCAS